MNKLLSAVLFFTVLLLAACSVPATTAPAAVGTSTTVESETQVVEDDSVVAASEPMLVEVSVVQATGPMPECLTYVLSSDEVLFKFCEVTKFHVYVDQNFMPAEGEEYPAAESHTVAIAGVQNGVEVVIWPGDSGRETKLYLSYDVLNTSAGATASSTEVLTDTVSTVTTTEVLTTAAIAEPVTVVAVVEGPVVGPCTQSWEENSDGTSVLELESGLGYFYLSMDNGDIWAEFPGEPTLSVHYVVSTHENKGAIAELHGATSVKVVVPMGTHRPDGTLCTYASPVSRTYLARELAAKTSPSGTRAVHLVFRPDGGVEVR